MLLFSGVKRLPTRPGRVSQRRIPRPTGRRPHRRKLQENRKMCTPGGRTPQHLAFEPSSDTGTHPRQVPASPSFAEERPRHAGRPHQPAGTPSSGTNSVSRTGNPPSASPRRGPGSLARLATRPPGPGPRSDPARAEWVEVPLLTHGRPRDRVPGRRVAGAGSTVTALIGKLPSSLSGHRLITVNHLLDSIEIVYLRLPRVDQSR